MYKRTIKFKGTPLHLAGRSLAAGSPAPGFTVVAQDMKEMTLHSFDGKTKLISVFPSLDTPVCDLQVKEFNRAAASLGEDVAVIGISMDLPFAQRRFCDENGIKKEVVLSDHAAASFGFNYGLLITELRLLARAVVIVDKANAVRYLRIVEEMTTPPDYADALEALRRTLAAPGSAGVSVPARGRPGEAGASRLAREGVEAWLKEHAGWQLDGDSAIKRSFVFESPSLAQYFLNAVNAAAEEEGHHPSLTYSYNKVRVMLTTHAAGGLTENDLSLAGIVDTNCL